MLAARTHVLRRRHAAARPSRRKAVTLTAVASLIGLGLATAPATSAGAGSTAPAAAVIGNGSSYQPAITPDGRYVGFASLASNLVPGDTNGKGDVFVNDREGSVTLRRVSVSSTGAQAKGTSSKPAISPDGRYVAFVSTANNLVAGDTNGQADLFLRDIWGGKTTRINVSTSGAQANAAVQDTPVFAGYGRYVAFSSAATNLVNGDTNAATDIFVRDFVAKTTSRVSVTTAGKQANGPSFYPTISGDGARVAFVTRAANILGGRESGLVVRDRVARTTTSVTSCVVTNYCHWYPWPQLTTDGRHLSYFLEITDSDGSTTFWDLKRYTFDTSDQFVSDGGLTDGSYAIDPTGAVEVYTGTAEGAMQEQIKLWTWGGADGSGAGITKTLDTTANSLTVSTNASLVSFVTLDALLPSDTNGKQDVYQWDTGTGAITMVSARSS